MTNILKGIIEQKLLRTMLSSENHVNNRFGWVQFFIFYENKTLAFVQQLECQQFNAKACILSVSSKDEMEVIRIDNIVSNCMFVSHDSDRKGFVCRFPNRLESD